MNRPLPHNVGVSPAHFETEYGFLVPHQVDAATLRRAVHRASLSGNLPHLELCSEGALTAEAYVAALEAHLVGRFAIIGGSGGAATASIWISALNDRPEVVAMKVVDAKKRGFAVLLGRSPALDAGMQPDLEALRAERAANDFDRRFPGFSARQPLPIWQLLAGVILLGLFAGGVLMAPEATLFAFCALLAVVFLAIVGLRLVALPLVWGGNKVRGDRGSRRAIARHDSQLPRYSVIVPLFREAEVLPDLVEALAALDYPASKLEILLVLELADTPTLAAARATDMPAHFRIVTVPEQSPMTKPKALNYALQIATGEFVVVYDAEDVPEPDQLRIAVDRFRCGGADLACLQARLNVHNPYDSWFSAQFTIEYSALFDGFLPALAKLRLPLPLGGTSNHFPIRVLRRAGGWDAYNVTEDADLGFRIARLGGRIEVLPSTTWEEAPAGSVPWFRQRTRWLKGWMLTYLVHMRRPGLLFRQLGLWRFLGFQIVLGGNLLSALIHPWFYILLAAGLWTGLAFQSSGSIAGDVILIVAVGNLIAGYASALVLAAASVVRRQRVWLMIHIVLMPLYWFLISLAAYRALWQALRAPYLWEKTPHRARRRNIGAGGPRQARDLWGA